MGRHLLDEHTANRLLSGVLAPDDAPPGYAAVAALLVAVRQPPTPQELAAASRTVVAMAEAIARNAAGAETQSVQGRRRAGLSRLLRPRIAATLMAGALALFGGLAEAGALPGPMQHAAHVLLGSIGISVPDSSSGTSPATTGPAQTNLWPPAKSGLGTTGHAPGTTAGTAGAHHGGRSNGRVHARAHHHVKSTSHHATVAHHARHHATHRASHHATHRGSHRTGHRTGTTTGTSSGDEDGSGSKGLCNAWKHGRGGERGKKDSATAFRRLQQRAQDKGETVEESCAGGGQGAAALNENQQGALAFGRQGGHGGGEHVGTTAHEAGKDRGHGRSPHGHRTPPGDESS